MFSRSKAARWRSGASTWALRRAERPWRFDAPGVVFTRAWATTDGRWIVVTYISQSMTFGSKQNVAWSVSSSVAQRARSRSTENVASVSA